MKLDWRIHFLGWHLFRGEPWHWPPGYLERYYHAPDGTSIGYTDSIPIVAFALKPFEEWLPMPFQYLGIWLLACFALQGVFGVLLVRLWSASYLVQLLGAQLFVMMPTLLNRVLQCGEPPVTFEGPAFLAGFYGVTVNVGEVARASESERAAYCAALDAQLSSGQVRDRELYLVHRSLEARIRERAPHLRCGDIDNLRVCVTDASYKKWSDAAALE